MKRQNKKNKEKKVIVHRCVTKMQARFAGILMVACRIRFKVVFPHISGSQQLTVIWIC